LPGLRGSEWRDRNGPQPAEHNLSAHGEIIAQLLGVAPRLYLALSGAYAEVIRPPTALQLMADYEFDKATTESRYRLRMTSGSPSKLPIHLGGPTVPGCRHNPLSHSVPSQQHSLPGCPRDRATLRRSFNTCATGTINGIQGIGAYRSNKDLLVGTLVRYFWINMAVPLDIERMF
jgi:hypothetical protein